MVAVEDGTMDVAADEVVEIASTVVYSKGKGLVGAILVPSAT